MIESNDPYWIVMLFSPCPVGVPRCQNGCIRSRCLHSKPEENETEILQWVHILSSRTQKFPGEFLSLAPFNLQFTTHAAMFLHLGRLGHKEKNLSEKVVIHIKISIDVKHNYI